MNADPREIALCKLVREARADSSPELDWSGIEERLLLQASRSAPPAPRRFTTAASGGFAMAAAAALWFGVMRAQQPPTAPTAQTEAQLVGGSNRDGDALSVGSRLTAEGGRELTVAHAGRASWTLSPDSSAVLASKDERITVRLEHGDVLSEVVKNPQPETFVVEAAGTRVAVHGTLFRVALRDGWVVVDVREGVVGVGPVGAQSAFFLKAGSHGDFKLDGRSGVIDGSRVGEAEQRPAEPPKPATRRGPIAITLTPSNAAPSPSAELPSEPSINDIEAGIAHIVDVTTDCFTRYTQSTDGVKITVRSALSLKILDSGAVAEMDFQPPLSPGAEQCAAAAIARVHFAPSKQGTQVTRMLELVK